MTSRSQEGTNNSNGSLKKLYLLLRNEGDRVLNGRSTFTLTTEVLSYLNADCRRHSSADLNGSITQESGIFLPLTKRLQTQQEVNKLKAEWSSQIQFIKDFMLSTPSLKIVHNSGTLTSPISLHRFGNLSSLNLHRVQIHMVEGLHKLRNFLISLTIYRSIDKLKDVLECCGGDMSAAMTWPALKFVSFTFNSFSSLDDSLRLLPCVQKLDLSHNSLYSCDPYLVNLNDVLCVTLAYNNLTKIPSFSMASRSSLVSLILRGNNLDTITGIEVLVSLQDLDLGENYLNDHSYLVPLGALSRLKQLQLDGNPIFYHRLHRALTVSCLSWHAVNSEFELDRRKLTVSEINHFMPQKKPVVSSIPLTYESRTNLMSSNLETNTDYQLSPSSGIGSETDSTDMIARPVSSKKIKHKKTKARRTEIRDMDTSGDLSSSQGATPGTSPAVNHYKHQTLARNEEARRTMKEVEELREHYGPNWLQAIEDKNIFNKKKLAQVPSSLVSASGVDQIDQESDQGVYQVSKDLETFSEAKSAEPKVEECPTEDDLYLRNTKPEEGSNPIMAQIARLAGGRSKSENAQISNIIETTKTSQKKISANENLNSNISERPQELLERKVFDDQTNPLPSRAAVRQSLASQTAITQSFPKLAITYSSKHTSSESSDRIQRENPDSDQCSTNSVSGDNSSVETNHRITLPKRDLEVKSSVTKTDNPNTTSKHVELTEAIFAHLPDKDNKIIIVSLTSTKLIEKDIRMKVTEKLELSSLASMDSCILKTRRHHEQKEDNSSSLDAETEEEVEIMQLDLKFDYMRKDRQTRCYHVEIDDGNMLMKHFQPILELREAEVKSKTVAVMQCLKCNSTFIKSELVHQKQSLPTSGSSRDLQSMKALIDTPTLICPKCASTIIIELTSPGMGVKSTSSANSTPVGSYSSSTGSFIEQAKTISTKKKKSLNVQPRKNSTSSLDLNFSRKINFDSVSCSGNNSGSWTQDSAMSNGRDRSNAFNANTKMVRSALLHGTSFSEAEELVCVEDYFSEVTKSSTSQQLAAMTSSLRGDLSTKGKTADVRRNTLEEVSTRRKKGENLNNSDADQLDKENTSSFQKLERPQQPSSLDSTPSISTTAGSNRDRSSSKTFIYKSLATMKEKVKALVSEGQNLLDQKSLSSSIRSRDNVRTVSVSALRKSSVTQRRDSDACTDSDCTPRLKSSDSNSSITILPTPAVVESGHTSLSSSLTSMAEPVKFSIGTPNDEGEEESVKNSLVSHQVRVVSPLNPDICNSMVSSVYMTSVTSPPGSDTDTLIDSLDTKTDIAPMTLDVINAHTQSDEDEITSIYDTTWFNSSSLAQKLEARAKTNSSQMTSYAMHSGAVDLPKAESPEFNNVNYASLAGYDNNNSDDDENEIEKQDSMVPQYAFHHLNHHLTLYMMMSMFENDEEFTCKLQSEIVQYIIEAPYEGILIMSSCRFYILKITSDDHSLPPDQWLTCVETQPIPELRYIDVGLGGQSFRLEFVTDCSSFTFITRNKEKTLQFVELLHTNLAKYAVSQGITSHVIVNEDVDQATLNNLEVDVVNKVSSGQSLLLYCMGFIERGNQKLFPVSFVVTTCDLCLVRANHQWPQPRLQGPITVDTVGNQFTVLERQKINNVAAVEVCETSMKKIRLELFNETEGISINWNITLVNRQTTVDFINALSEPWAKEFGVEMEISYAELDF
ncbi:uncharacterized protein LOC106068855 [Biomphalaria glabrata]|uniref:Uncharacterized protein LOC106068855 n=1 Tax=Biomphalaria glabrata TaxID=6526 RepID=A0A9W2YAP4_BIOGL|nr:uncharacterized protein LOC106068855 [Biomphalaria glabrata]XP_055859811.1 uncharacterized protein LOC106068855 [Biomphalaria glabrata]XP_055859813.1 uncharacterized protein LOC106068855 [Biomphalaria glabrata]